MTITNCRNATLIYNPAAGGLNGGTRRLERVLAILRESGYVVRAEATQGPGSAAAVARRSIEAGAGLILAAGGDGTVNETLGGVVNTGVPLAVLPAGTANVLACELKLGGLTQAAANVHRWVPRRVAAGLLRSEGSPTARYFLLMAGAGLDAHIVNAVNLGIKRRGGKLAYWLAGVRELGRRLEEFDAVVNGAKRRCSFALASRVRNYGGNIRIARNASLLRDDFEVVLFEDPNPFRYLKYLLGALTDKLNGMTGVSFHRARRVDLIPQPGMTVYVQVDGEAAGKLPASIEIVPGAATLLVPPEFTR